MSTVKASKKLGALIRERRKANALTQSELAHRLKVAQPTVSQWEVGKLIPTSEQQAKLDEILGGSGRMKRASATLRLNLQLRLGCLGHLGKRA